MSAVEREEPKANVKKEPTEPRSPTKPQSRPANAPTSPPGEAGRPSDDHSESGCTEPERCEEDVPSQEGREDGETDAAANWGDGQKDTHDTNDKEQQRHGFWPPVPDSGPRRPHS